MAPPQSALPDDFLGKAKQRSLLEIRSTLKFLNLHQLATPTRCLD